MKGHLWLAVGAVAVCSFAVGVAAPPEIAAHRVLAAPVTTAEVCLTGRSPTLLDTMFDTEPGGVIGADYQRAFALDDGRVLWTFQDAAVRRGPDEVVIVHNIAVMQDGTCFTVMYRGSRAVPEPMFFAERTERFERWFWPLDAALGDDGMVHVFVAEMREAGADYLTRTVPVGTWVAVVDPATGRVVDEVRSPDASAALYGWSITSDHRWTYLYGHCYRQFGYDDYLGVAAFDRSCATDITVARVPRGKLLDRPDYWDGHRWQADPALASPIVDADGRRINADQFEWTGAGFVSVNKEGDWWGDTVYVSRSSAPTGPFTVIEASPAPVKCAIDCNSFFSGWVPAAAVDVPDGTYVYSLSHNRWDGRTTSLYRPTFLTTSAPRTVSAGGVFELEVDPALEAVAITVTTVDPSGAGFLTVYPCAGGRPLASNLNHHLEPVVANLVLVRPDAEGRVCLYSMASTDLVVDLAGEFPSGSGVVPAERSVRIADTRDGTGVRAGRVSDGDVLELPVEPVPTGTAVALNVAAADPLEPGFLTLFPCDAPRPETSNVNIATEPAVSNLVVVEPDADGSVCVASHRATHVVVDFVGTVRGEFGQAHRLIDTRSTADGRLGQGGELAVVVPGDEPTALVNVIAVEPDGPGFLTVYPCDRPRPATSNVNYAVRPVVSNLVVVAPDGDRRVCIYSHEAVDIVVDRMGGLDASLPPSAPTRLMDTRNGLGVPGQLGDG